MDAEREASKVREAVGIFADANTLQDAIDDVLGVNSRPIVTPSASLGDRPLERTPDTLG